MLKGAKWSDGSPFTSADILFWFNDVYCNPELKPAKLPWLYNSDGSLVEVTAPDDYTVVFTWKDPITTVPMEVAAMDNRDNLIPMFLPSAYLKQFPASYTNVDE
jgi:peptide/nickel transport system substrate-binding protein